MPVRYIVAIVVFYLVVQVSAATIVTLIYASIPMVLRLFLLPVISVFLPVGSTIVLGIYFFKKGKKENPADKDDL